MEWTTNREYPLTFSLPLSRSLNNISIPQANGSTNGYLSSSDWISFSTGSSLWTINTTNIENDIAYTVNLTSALKMNGTQVMTIGRDMTNINNINTVNLYAGSLIRSYDYNLIWMSDVETFMTHLSQTIS